MFEVLVDIITYFLPNSTVHIKVSQTHLLCESYSVTKITEGDWIRFGFSFNSTHRPKSPTTVKTTFRLSVQWPFYYLRWSSRNTLKKVSDLSDFRWMMGKPNRDSRLDLEFYVPKTRTEVIFKYHIGTC